MSGIVTNIEELTPIEEYNGILFKRDDLYQPFNDIPLSGGKVRQAIKLIQNNLSNIKENYNNTVITATSVNSPQGIIVSRVAKEYNVDSILVFGNTKRENLIKNNLTHNAMLYATRIDTESKLAYDSVLSHRVRKLCEEENKSYFFIKFGINLEEDKDAIVDTVANQCLNIPDDLDYLFVPAGSAIMLGGIIKGCYKFNKHPHIVGIQISGYNREKTVKNILNINSEYNKDIKKKDIFNQYSDPEYEYEYDFIIDNTYPYSKHLKIEIGPGFVLDPVYESKAYEYMIKHYDLKNKKTLFWVVGDSNMVRNNYYG